jgi:copper chaperone CopZ
MERICKVENLDCAVCAAKIEKAVGKLDGVSSASINFMTGKMILDIDESKESDVLKQIDKVIRKIEPDSRLKTV